MFSLPIALYLSQIALIISALVLSVIMEKSETLIDEKKPIVKSHFFSVFTSLAIAILIYSMFINFEVIFNHFNVYNAENTFSQYREFVSIGISGIAYYLIETKRKASLAKL